ncbi:MAG: hypothetical protein QF879_06180 [Candidatus Latescibacteria bacterium]|nr:hypothetical protein [Candidatus Latescibacterota bacterium]
MPGPRQKKTDGTVVPEHPNNTPPTVVVLGDGERHPEMLDASRAIDFTQRALFTCFDATEAGIATGRVAAGNAVPRIAG